ncbi:hypothetical protein CDL15_Pgr020730 [Punica granatum]|uniref:Secreted protein n=1 Tax=Punica granatum TaxID=22663 RepID=A0A218XHC2_PUNGR|nr:hypothetical protein CDL15_Pgr020730 [Punica granatum]
MLVAIWLTVPSRAAMRAWSLVAAEVGETGGRGAPKDAGGGRCVGRALEYTGSTPTGVRGRDRRVDFFRNIDVIPFRHPEPLTSRVAV